MGCRHEAVGCGATGPGFYGAAFLIGFFRFGRSWRFLRWWALFVDGRLLRCFIKLGCLLIFLGRRNISRLFGNRFLFSRRDLGGDLWLIQTFFSFVCFRWSHRFGILCRWLAVCFNWLLAFFWITWFIFHCNFIDWFFSRRLSLFFVNFCWFLVKFRRYLIVYLTSLIIRGGSLPFRWISCFLRFALSALWSEFRQLRFVFGECALRQHINIWVDLGYLVIVFPVGPRSYWVGFTNRHVGVSLTGVLLGSVHWGGRTRPPLIWNLTLAVNRINFRSRRCFLGQNFWGLGIFTNIFGGRLILGLPWFLFGLWRIEFELVFLLLQRRLTALPTLVLLDRLIHRAAGFLWGWFWPAEEWLLFLWLSWLEGLGLFRLFIVVIDGHRRRLIVFNCVLFFE